jgi:hypothetical protein
VRSSVTLDVTDPIEPEVESIAETDMFWGMLSDRGRGRLGRTSDTLARRRGR